METKKLNLKFWLISSIILTALFFVSCNNMFYLSKDVSNISITSKNSIFKQSQLRISEIDIDGQIYKASDIFTQYLSEEDGSIVINSNEEVHGILPSGEHKKIIFESGPYRGNAYIDLDGEKYNISTYSGYWGKIHFNLQTETSLTKNIIYSVIFFLLLSFTYVAVDFVFFKKVKIKLLFKQYLILLSCLMLTILLSSNAQSLIASVVSISIALPLYVHFILKSYEFKNNNKTDFIAILSTICVMVFIVRGTYSPICSTFLGGMLNPNIVICVIYASIIPSMFCIISLFINSLSVQISDFISIMDIFEKKFFIVTSSVYTVIIYFLYSQSSAFSDGLYINQMGGVSQRAADIIYGYDHSWILSAFSEFSSNSYDFRHPIIRLITIIPTSVLKLISFFVEPLFPQAYGFLMAIFFMLLMVITAILLKRMINCKIIAPLYSVTYFFIIMCLGAEQYQISVFLLVSCVYMFIKKQYKSAYCYSILMSCATLTSGYMVPFSIKFDNIKNYINNLIKYCFIFLAVISAGGSFPAGISTLNEISNYKSTFALIDKIKVFTNYVTWTFISPNTEIKDLGAGAYAFTSNVPTTFNIIGIIILFLCIMSFYLNRKDKLCQISFWTVCFSAILCVVLGWSLEEAWLHVILFSWGYMILLIKLLERLIKNNRYRMMILYAIFVIIILFNGIKIKEIFDFAINYYPCVSY